MFGRHFGYENHLVSKMTRESTDQLKLYYENDLSNNDWILVEKLKKIFNINFC